VQLLSLLGASKGMHAPKAFPYPSGVEIICKIMWRDELRFLKKAGFQHKICCSKDPLAASTLRMDKKRGDVDHVHAGSLCQGYSYGNRNGGKNDV
jgi:site-specific DNA-cytosine methylase